MLAIGIGERVSVRVGMSEESPRVFHVRRWQELREGRVGKRGIGEKNN